VNKINKKKVGIAILVVILIVFGGLFVIGMMSDGSDSGVNPSDVEVETSSEEFVKDYLTALNEGDIASAENMIHEGGWYSEVEERNIEVYEIEERGIREAYEDSYTTQQLEERLDVETYDQAIQKWEDNIKQNILEQANADDLDIVYYSITDEDLGDLDEYFVIVQVDGEYLLYSPF